jgi:hypothetical protein
MFLKQTKKIVPIVQINAVTAYCTANDTGSLLQKPITPSCVLAEEGGQAFAPHANREK